MSKGSSIASVEQFEQASTQLALASAEVAQVIIGQDRVIERTLVTLLAGGHGLLVGLPGLAKTKLVETLAVVLGLDMRRVQFTPDLMPADILGSEVLDETANGTKSFRFLPGPVFAQMLMADEINRASPRTQSALLQAMQEHHISVAGVRHDLPEPFHVLATQNPLEQEGTYPLPEAQLDRFLLQIDVTYPDRAAERRIILETTGTSQIQARQMISAQNLRAFQLLVRQIPLGETIIDAILDLVRAARPDQGGISEALAWSPGRLSPSLADVAELAEPVLKHRMALTYAARAEGQTVEGQSAGSDAGIHALADAAFELGRALPNLTLQARQIAASVLQGVHGRRKAGAGDQFWQYRPYAAGDSIASIDWRRSARASHIMLKEREWQAAQKVWLWMDGAPSMCFASKPELPTKRDCAFVLGLALADMLVRGGERVGLIGIAPLQASRAIITHFAGNLLAQRNFAKLPQGRPLEPRAQAIWISDFLAPLPEIEQRLRLLAGQGARGVLVLISDPQEDLFPFFGHVEFSDTEQATFKPRFGRAELIREIYLNRRAAHIEALGQMARKANGRLFAGFGCSNGISLMIPLTFAAPFVLAAFVVLPALYYLLRVTPPPPKRVIFPPTQLFLQDNPSESEATRTPWWILLLRLLMMAVIVLAVSGPVWQPQISGSSGPLLIVLDDSWPAAPQWSRRIELARQKLQMAASLGRVAALALTSHGSQDILFQPADKVLEKLAAVSPSPVLFDHMPLLQPIRANNPPNLEIEWFSDGLASGEAQAFAKALADMGALHITLDQNPVLAIAGFEQSAAGPKVRLVRSNANAPQSGSLRALDSRARVISAQGFQFTTQTTQDVALDLPVDLRNQIDHFEIEGVHSAGSLYLLDESNRRAHVGLFAQLSADVAQQPLLSSLYYLKKALASNADLVLPPEGAFDPVSAMLDAEPSELILADVGVFSAVQTQRLNKFVADGGVLVRFAGSHLTDEADPFLPVKLRHGQRAFGGALSWDVPKKLGTFEDSSPFAGLVVPDDVTVSRQVLAEPEAGLPAKVWASLADGTPLVTAQTRGKGLVVLFHINADTSWSNLPLSGLFVDMLQRVSRAAHMGAGAQGKGVTTALTPRLNLDGFGELGAPSPKAQSLPAHFEGPASLEHPPGLYGEAGHDLALNAMAHLKTLPAFDTTGLSVNDLAGEAQTSFDLRGPLMILALLLFLLDCALVLKPRRWRALAMVLALGLVPLAIGKGQAQQAIDPAKLLNSRDIEASLNVHLGYILTGNKAVDDLSRQGLQTVSRQLARRTSVTPGEPIGLDPARDVLDLYPLIYWPVVAEADLPSPQAVQHMATYMSQGGTLLFDTRDALLQRPDGAPTPAQIWLRRALHGLDVPALEPVPHDHVMTKSFYLLDGFVGRTTLGETFVEVTPPTDEAHPAPVRAGDSVSPIIITSNDLAAGWATDDMGRGILPLLPGGPRQRELALRGGINIVMCI
eukprot:gene13462-13577_t